MTCLSLARTDLGGVRRTVGSVRGGIGSVWFVGEVEPSPGYAPGPSYLACCTGVSARGGLPFPLPRVEALVEQGRGPVRHSRGEASGGFVCRPGPLQRQGRV